MLFTKRIIVCKRGISLTMATTIAKSEQSNEDVDDDDDDRGGDLRKEAEKKPAERTFRSIGSR